MTADAFAAFVFRTAFNASALLAIGLALHASLAVVARSDVRRWRAAILAAALTMIAFAAVRVVILAGQLGADGAGFDPTIGSLVWAALGPATLSALAGGLAIGTGALSGWRIALGLGSFAAAAGFALTGHTRDLPHAGLAPAALALHVLIAGFWIAAPLTLWPRAGIPDATLRARLTRFSAYAVAAIPILIAAGMWLAWRLAGGFAGLLDTLYGRLLLLKLGVAMGALAAGAFNKQFVTRLFVRDPVQGRRWLRRSLTAEIVLFSFAVLSVSAATTFTGPGE